MLKRTEVNYFQTVHFHAQPWTELPDIDSASNRVFTAFSTLLFRRGKLRCILRCTLVRCNDESHSHVRFPRWNVFFLFFIFISYRLTGPCFYTSSAMPFTLLSGRPLSHSVLHRRRSVPRFSRSGGSNVTI